MAESRGREREKEKKKRRHLGATEHARCLHFCTMRERERGGMEERFLNVTPLCVVRD